MENGDEKTAAMRRGQGPGSVYQPGDVLAGHFEIVRVLGFGGMGVVYEATNRFSDERIALKCIKSIQGARRQSNVRFIEEINTARKLRHPNIVAVYDVAQDGDQLFFTMEYLDGVSLRGRLNQSGRLPLEDVVQIMRPLCDALEYAHRFMIHRDLSPDNVIVLRDGGVKLLDFGLARDVARETMTMTGARIGKAQYMSPEQRKDAAHVDARTDIYALGVMFYELLSGQLPLGYARLSDHVPELPPACDDLVGRALAPLEQRIRSAAEFRAALDACVATKHAEVVVSSPPRVAVPPPEPQLEAPAEAPATHEDGRRRARRSMRTLAVAALGLLIAASAMWKVTQFLPTLSGTPAKPTPPRVDQVVQPKSSEPKSVPNPLFPVALKLPETQETAIALDKVYKTLSYPPPPAPLSISWEVNENEAILHLPGEVVLAMRWIPPGSYSFGEPFLEKHDFLPVHPVTLTHGFWLGKEALTQAQWKAVMTVNPSVYLADALPVNGISWDDAMLFVRRLNRLGVKQFRLPTEAEWLYACQAGVTEPGPPELNQMPTNHDGGEHVDGRGGLIITGRIRKSPWGLHDLPGNVFEWCSDYYSPDYKPDTAQVDPQGAAQGFERVAMGGCPFLPTPCNECEYLHRNWYMPEGRAYVFGMRLCAD